MHKWYVVQVLSGHEKKVKKTLEEFREAHKVSDLIEEVLLPTENVSEVKAGQQRITEKRIWPGYLLMKMTLSDESWQYVKGTDGVIDFLGGGSPTALSDGEVAQILEDLREKKETVTQKHKLAVGDRVKVIDGIFINCAGTVTEVFHDKGRLNVLVFVFGRDTKVEDLEFWQVEEATEENEG